MYKKMIKTLVMVGLVAVTFGSIPALAEEDAPSASADVAVLTDYIWRGYHLSEDSIVIQPSATVSYKGFSFNLWGNLDTDQYGMDDSNFNETDMTLSYDWSFDTVSMGAGYIYYGLDGEDTQEFYLTAALDTILAPSLSIYRDVDTFPGWYFNIGLSHSIAFSDDLALDLSAAFGYLDADYYDYSALHDGNVSASMTFGVNKYISVTPMIAYSFALSSDAKVDMADVKGDYDHLYGGITMSVAF